MPPDLPLERLDCVGFFVVGIAFALLALSTGKMMTAYAVTMRSTGGVGHLGLELLGSWAKAGPVLDAWRAAPDGKAAARAALRVDFGFIAGYVGLGVTVATAAAIRMADRPWPGWAAGARWAGWALVVAGLLDIVENLMLFRVLAEKTNANWPRYAAWFAKLKWGLATPAALVVLSVGVAALGRRVAL